MSGSEEYILAERFIPDPNCIEPKAVIENLARREYIIGYDPGMPVPRIVRPENPPEPHPSGSFTCEMLELAKAKLVESGIGDDTDSYVSSGNGAWYRYPDGQAQFYIVGTEAPSTRVRRRPKPFTYDSYKPIIQALARRRVRRIGHPTETLERFAPVVFNNGTCAVVDLLLMDSVAFERVPYSERIRRKNLKRLAKKAKHRKWYRIVVIEHNRGGA